MDEVADLGAITATERFGHVDPDTIHEVIAEVGRFMAEVVAPTNRDGDTIGSQWQPDGSVVTPDSFKPAYAKWVESGFGAMPFDSEYGGAGFPWVSAIAVQELLTSANMALSLCPLLTQGAIDAIHAHGSESQKSTYLPKMLTGEWSGTMNLTEPQAGSDLAAIRTRAQPQGDHYRLFGQKIFITYGEHDFTPNTIHLVLARIDGAPAGVKGISMFVVPKVLVNDDGSLGDRNDVHCLSIEHKLGIHASPTCVMAYGQGEGAVGYLVGEPNRGLEYMFVMMNAARLSVGLEGYAVAERAYQQALDWANTRIQGKPPGVTGEAPAPIVHHPDVKRMLLSMKSQIEALRALTLYTAWQLDLGAQHADETARRRAQARGDLLIPVVKACSTEAGIELASLGIQIHGGMGFVEETGAAQAYRDVRITTIYEGTTAIQSNDFVGRKIARDRGEAMATLITDMRAELQALRVEDAAVMASRDATLAAVDELEAVTRGLLASYAMGPERVLAVSVPMVRLAGLVIGGWLLTFSAAIAAHRLANGAADRDFLQGKVDSARFYAAQVLPQAGALARVVTAGAESVIEVAPSALAR